MRLLQWGPVVVTGISRIDRTEDREEIKTLASMGSGRGDRNQWPTTTRWSV